MEQLYKTVIYTGTAIMRRHLPDSSWPWYVNASQSQSQSQSHSHSHSDAQTSMFLELPKEVRDMILGYLLLEEGRIVLYYDKHVGYVYREEINSRFRDYLDRCRFGWTFYISGHAHEMVQHSTTRQRMLELSSVCRQIRFEAQEMFFCRNRFILLTSPRPSSRLIELHSRWVSKVSLWCRPSMGLWQPVWLSVDVERVSGAHMFEIRWSRFRYNDEDVNAESKDGVCVQSLLQEWVSKNHVLLLDKLRTSIAEKGAQLDMNVLIDFFGGPPKCKQMSLCIYPEPTGRIQTHD